METSENASASCVQSILRRAYLNNELRHDGLRVPHEVFLLVISHRQERLCQQHSLARTTPSTSTMTHLLRYVECSHSGVNWETPRVLFAASSFHLRTHGLPHCDPAERQVLNRLLSLTGVRVASLFERAVATKLPRERERSGLGHSHLSREG